MNNINILGNNNIQHFTNFNNNINSIGNMNFAHNIKNNRNNLVPQIYEQDPKQPMIRTNTTIPNINNFDINNKMNTN